MKRISSSICRASRAPPAPSAPRTASSPARALARVGLYTDSQLILTGDGDAEVLRGQRVNAGFFDALGVHPLLGRLITADDERTPRASVVVLSHELWTARFGADPSVVGRVYTLNGQPSRVIGVLGPDFQPFRMANAAVALLSCAYRGSASLMGFATRWSHDFPRNRGVIRVVEPSGPRAA